MDKLITFPRSSRTSFSLGLDALRDNKSNSCGEGVDVMSRCLDKASHTEQIGIRLLGSHSEKTEKIDLKLITILSQLIVVDCALGVVS